MAPGLLLILGLCILAAWPAIAQDQVYIVCDSTRDSLFTGYTDATFFRELHTSSPTDDDPFDPGFIDGTDDSLDDILIIVDREGPDGGPVGVWDTDAITIDQTDVSVRILGARLDTNANTDIVVERATGNATYDLIDVEGDNTRVRIENLTLTGADDASAVAVTSPTDAAQVLVNQCYIYDNQTGVSAGEAGGTGDADTQVFLVNCSLKDNATGVLVTDSAQAEVLFCSIFANTTYGVHADGTDAARVWNSIVFMNPDDTADDTNDGNGDFWVENAADEIMAAYCYLSRTRDPLTDYGAGPVTVEVAGTLYDHQANPPLAFDGEGVDPPSLAFMQDAAVWGRVDFSTVPAPFVDGRIPANWFTPWETGAWAASSDGFPWNAINYVFDDFEGDARPQGLAEIGADERDLGLGAQQWDYCLVVPQEPYEAVGLTVPGVRDLTFEVWVGLNVATPLDYSIRAWFIPQGGLDDGLQTDPAQIGDWVTIDASMAAMEVNEPATTPLTYFPALNLWRGEGRILSTVIEERDGDGGIPSANDLIADGHAAIYIQFDDGTGSGWEKADPGLVVGQAQIGRHFLVDTIPPDLLDTPKNAVSTLDGTLVGLFNVVGHNGSGAYGAPGAIPSLLHPYPALPTGWRPSTIASPPDAPYDEGLIYTEPTTGQGAQAFFNVDSYSNDDPSTLPNPPQEPLDIRLEARFYDPPVRDENGLPVDGNDQFSDGTNRQVTGFPPTPSTRQGDELLEAAPLVFSEGGEILSAGIAGYDVDVLFDPAPGYTWADAVVQNRGFDYQRPATEALPTPVVVPGPEDVLAMRWRFESDNGAITESGIHWIGDVPVDHLHLATELVAIDLAGNARLRDVSSTASGYALAPDPLHMWWMLQARTWLRPNNEGQRVPAGKLETRWGLERDYDPNPAGQPEPLFTYRLWRSQDGSNDPPGWQPVTSWASWSPNRILTASDWETIIDDAIAAGLDILDHHVLLVVVGADEAGNVEQWPWADWAYNDPAANAFTGDGESLARLSVAPAGSNWQRFFIESPGASLDTTAKIRFAHGVSGADLGSNPLVPVPANETVEVTVDLGFAYETFTPTTPLTIWWDIVSPDQSSEIVLRGVSGFTSTQQTIRDSQVLAATTSVGGTGPTLENAGLWPTNDNREVPLVFRARAVLTATGQADTTPVNIPFTLVWKSVPNYVTPPDDSDEQPVKEQRKE